MSTPYTDLKLSPEQIRILKNIKRKGCVPGENIKKDQQGKYNFLFKYHLIDYFDSSHQYYCLSDKAIMLLLYRNESNLRFYLPIVISVIAIIISIISLLKQ